MVNADIIWSAVWRLTFGPEDIHSAPMLIRNGITTTHPSLKTRSTNYQIDIDRPYLVNMTNDARRLIGLDIEALSLRARLKSTWQKMRSG